MKVYISSTYQDLSEHRAAVDRTLRRMGQDVIGMEQYVAEGNKPLDRCLADVRLADLYVIIVGWRYGYIPVDQPPPGMLSITELEYGAVESAGKPVLAFLLDPDTPWPTRRVDAMSAEPQRGEAQAGANIRRFRSMLGTKYLAGMFRTPDDLASQVAAAVAARGSIVSWLIACSSRHPSARERWAGSVKAQSWKTARLAASRAWLPVRVPQERLSWISATVTVGGRHDCSCFPVSCWR
jgi:hypothetical protein